MATDTQGAMAPIAPPASVPSREAANKAAGRARHQANVKKYGNPLPILLPSSGSTLRSQSSSSPAPSSSSSSSILTSYIPSFLTPSSSSKVEFPECIGTFDPVTRSVWITDPSSIQTIFNRGFFGKGSLSRSEPSWRARRVDLLKGGESAAVEQLREKRRLERKKFKMDRAQAMLDAAKQAEAILTSASAGPSSTTTGTGSSTPLVNTPKALDDDDGGEAEGVFADDHDSQRPGSPTPSTSTITTTGTTIDPTTLTPQTFLVRPIRPDQNRNRGRNAFRRRPPPSAPASAPSFETTISSGPDATAQPPASASNAVRGAKADIADEEEEDEEGSEFDESIVEEMEHLQLGLEEAIFLSLGLGVLRIFDPINETYPAPGPALLSLLLTPSTSLTQTSLTSPSLSTSQPIYTPLRPDDPLLVSYVAYHHYRSLGWVVKSGVKFCVDWLLYRKGPAFSHSAFACLMIPVYSDPQDRIGSPFGDTDWYEERLSWKWVNTIMRVNSLVQKTVIAVYITIPSLSSFHPSAKLPNGTLDLNKNNLDSLLRRYTVREVSLTRFGPARRRD